MDTIKPQTVVLLEITNFKTITCFRAEFDATKPGGVVIIAGENGAGKTSILESIEGAITGTMPAEPLKLGEKAGRVVVKTQDFVFTQRITASGTRFELANAEGAVYKSPRALLATFFSKIGFDPLAFAGMKDAERTEELLRICPVAIDLKANAAEAKRLYDERTIANREVARIAAHLASLPEQTGPVQPMVSVTALNDEKNARLKAHQERNAGLSAELEKLREQERINQEKRTKLKYNGNAIETTNRDISLNDQTVERLKRELAEAHKKQELLNVQLEVLVKDQAALNTEVDNLPDLLPTATALKAKLAEPCDTADIDAKIASAEQINAAAEEARQRANAHAEAKGQVADAEAEAKRLDDEYKAKLKAREDALKAAKFPVKGLSIDADGAVRLNDALFSQASTAQQIDVGVSLAAEASPAMRIVTVRDGSLLDDRSMAVLREKAEKHGLQVWVERISDTSDGVITLEDGHRK